MRPVGPVQKGVTKFSSWSLPRMTQELEERLNTKGRYRGPRTCVSCLLFDHEPCLIILCSPECQIGNMAFLGLSHNHCQVKLHSLKRIHPLKGCDTSTTSSPKMQIHHPLVHPILVNRIEHSLGSELASLPDAPHLNT